MLAEDEGLNSVRAVHRAIHLYEYDYWREPNSVILNRAKALLEDAIVRCTSFDALFTSLWRKEFSFDQKMVLVRRMRIANPVYALIMVSHVTTGNPFESYRLGHCMHVLGMENPGVVHFRRRQQLALESIREWCLVARRGFGPEGGAVLAVCKDVRRMIGLYVWQTRACYYRGKNGGIKYKRRGRRNRLE